MPMQPSPMAELPGLRAFAFSFRLRSCFDQDVDRFSYVHGRPPLTVTLFVQRRPRLRRSAARARFGRRAGQEGRTARRRSGLGGLSPAPSMTICLMTTTSTRRLPVTVPLDPDTGRASQRAGGGVTLVAVDARSEIREFLRSRREMTLLRRACPLRRDPRVPRLRREEVALLARVSVLADVSDL